MPPSCADPLTPVTVPLMPEVGPGPELQRSDGGKPGEGEPLVFRGRFQSVILAPGRPGSDRRGRSRRPGTGPEETQEVTPANSGGGPYCGRRHFRYVRPSGRRCAPRVPGESRNTPERSGSRTGRDARSDAGRPGGEYWESAPFPVRKTVRPAAVRPGAQAPAPLPGVLSAPAGVPPPPRRPVSPPPSPALSPAPPRALPARRAAPRAGPDRAETRSARAAAPPRSAHLDCGPGARGPVRGARPGRPRQPAAARSALGIHVAGVYT